MNLIILYADKQGILKNIRQRKVITIGDMIVSGEKEGPMLPVPKKTYSIVFADNSVLFDVILVRFMGFQENKFKLLREARKNKKLIGQKINDCDIHSNCAQFNKKVLLFQSGYKFEPSMGWKGYL